MAINKAIIQIRRGLKDDLQIDKLLPGELAIATDAPCMWFCWSVGNVEQVPTSDNLSEVKITISYDAENKIVRFLRAGVTLLELPAEKVGEYYKLLTDTDLTEAGVPADAAAVGKRFGKLSQENAELKSDLNELNSKVSNSNKLLGEYSKVLFTNLDKSTTGTISNTAIWFLNGRFDAYTMIESITLCSNMSVGKTTNVKVAIWQIKGSYLLKKTEQEIHYTENGEGKIIIYINEIPKYPFKISIYTSNTASVQYTQDAAPMLYKKDLTGTEFAISELSSLPTTAIKCDILTRENYMGIVGNVITVGKNKQYETIQDAIDNANDSADNHVTILVFPGIYEPFSMVGFPFVTGDNSKNRLRYLSIIGLDLFSTFVIDHVGDYRKPPAEIRTRGVISNIQFITDHSATTDDSDWPESEKKRRAYGIHMDFGTGQNVIIQNCIIRSAQAPAIGIGLYQDDNIKIHDCELYSTADNSFGGLQNYGALYCHTCNFPNVTNQNISVKNCIIESRYSNRGGAWFQILQNGDGRLKSINTMYISFASNAPKVTNDGFTVLPQSYGNNSEIVNHA